jgi:hypothetical protein
MSKNTSETTNEPSRAITTRFNIVTYLHNIRTTECALQEIRIDIREGKYVAELSPTHGNLTNSFYAGKALAELEEALCYVHDYQLGPFSEMPNTKEELDSFGFHINCFSEGGNFLGEILIFRVDGVLRGFHTEIAGGAKNVTTDDFAQSGLLADLQTVLMRHNQRAPNAENQRLERFSWDRRDAFRAEQAPDYTLLLFGDPNTGKETIEVDLFNAGERVHGWFNRVERHFKIRQLEARLALEKLLQLLPEESLPERRAVNEAIVTVETYRTIKITTKTGTIMTPDIDRLQQAVQTVVDLLDRKRSTTLKQHELAGKAHRAFNNWGGFMAEAVKSYLEDFRTTLLLTISGGEITVLDSDVPRDRRLKNPFTIRRTVRLGQTKVGEQYLEVRQLENGTFKAIYAGRAGSATTDPFRKPSQKETDEALFTTVPGDSRILDDGKLFVLSLLQKLRCAEVFMRQE